MQRWLLNHCARLKPVVQFSTALCPPTTRSSAEQSICCSSIPSVPMTRSSWQQLYTPTSRCCDMGCHCWSLYRPTTICWRLRGPKGWRRRIRTSIRETHIKEPYERFFKESGLFIEVPNETRLRHQTMSEEQLRELAAKLGAVGPLSEVIIQER